MGLDDDKLKDLSQRIQQSDVTLKPDAVFGSASRAGWDFVGAILGSCIIGALLDYTFGTSPWCLLGLMMVGFVLGIVQACISMRRADDTHT